jgi:WD40 repeat protein
MSAERLAGARAPLHIEAPFVVAGMSLLGGGNRVVAGGRDGGIVTWDAASGTVVSSVKYAGPAQSDVTFSADGALLAIAGQDRSLRILEAGTLSERRVVQGVSEVQGSLCFSPDARFLAGAARSRALNVTVWRVDSGLPLPSFHDASVEANSIAFSPDNSTLVVGTGTGDILVVEVMTQRRLRTLSEPLMASDGVAFSADGKLLVAAPYDGSLFVWDTSKWTVRRLPAPRASTAVAISPEETHLAVCSTSFNPGDSMAEAALLRWPSGEVVTRQSLGIASITALAFVSPGRARVATARGQAIAVWELG